MSRPPEDPGVFDALPRDPSPYTPPPTDPPAYDPRNEPPRVVPVGNAFPWGCLWGGCLGAMLLMLVLVIVVGFGTFRYYKQQIAQYTSPEARQLPVVELSPEELEELETRVETFQQTAQEGEAAEPLVLDSEDLNALISQEEQLRGRVFVTIKDGLIQAEVSFPADVIPGAEGRYFNASANINASLEDGDLVVTLDSAEANGHVVPEAVMKNLRKQNFAKDVNKNPELAQMIDQFERLAIEGDKLILTPKPAKPSEASEASPPRDGPETGTAPGKVNRAA